MIGQTLTHFRITDLLGEGGMGKVYRAEDLKLGREVAIKVLPADFSTDSDRRSRFEREARVLAALNHSGIAAIYEVDEEAEQHFLVMELVPGETLEERIARGPLPLPDAIQIAHQIAIALEAAHGQGIVHRDLKPANIKQTQDGTIKVLDFGLAKVWEGALGSGDLRLTQSPTLTGGATRAGVLLGTAAYMSPEQAKGLEADQRADIWAFGLVLWEMLTGKNPYAEATLSETLASVLRTDPDPDELPADTPRALRRLLRRCLEKDSHRRLHAMADARLELEETSEPEAESPHGADLPPKKNWLWQGISALLLISLAGLASWWSLGRSVPAPEPVTRFALRDIGMPVDTFFGLALSPDGQNLVYRARDENDQEYLYLRSFDSLEAVKLPGTQDGWLPFISPDGDRVAFMGNGALMAVGISGGSARSVAEFIGGFSGGTWLPDGNIVFAQAAGRHLYRVPASGGEIEVLEIGSSEEGDLVASPFALPDGDALLCTWGRRPSFNVALYDLRDGSIEVLVENAFTPTYIETGHILYQEGVSGSLMALPFDAEDRVVTGVAFPVVDDLGTRVSYQVRMFAVGGSTLAYVPSSSYLDSGSLVWVDRLGSSTPIVDIGAIIGMPSLSPDGKRVAFRATAPNCDVWVHDLERGATSRVTFEGDNHGTVWSPDGQNIVLARNESPDWGILSIAADGSGGIERMSPPEISRAGASSISSDGRYVLVSTHREETGDDIDLVEVASQSVTPLLQSRFDEEAGAFSPDGGLIAFVSNESGRQEVYLQSFPDMDHRQQVSIHGGTEPVWSASGEELFFRTGRKIMATAVTRGESLVVGSPSQLFEGPSMPDSGFSIPSYDVTNDGERFIMVHQKSGDSGAEIYVTRNWLGQLPSLATGAPAR